MTFRLDVYHHAFTWFPVVPAVCTPRLVHHTPAHVICWFRMHCLHAHHTVTLAFDVPHRPFLFPHIAALPRYIYLPYLPHTRWCHTRTCLPLLRAHFSYHTPRGYYYTLFTVQPCTVAALHARTVTTHWITQLHTITTLRCHVLPFLPHTLLRFGCCLPGPRLPPRALAVHAHRLRFRILHTARHCTHTLLPLPHTHLLRFGYTFTLYTHAHAVCLPRCCTAFGFTPPGYRC